MAPDFTEEGRERFAREQAEKREAYLRVLKLMETKKATSDAEDEMESQDRPAAEQKDELARLCEKYSELRGKTSEDIQALLKQLPPQATMYSSESGTLDQIIADYKAQFSGKDFFEEPQRIENGVMLTFESDEQADKFARQQASKGRKFDVRSPDGEWRHSKGDGKLYEGRYSETNHQPADANPPVTPSPTSSSPGSSP